MGDHESNRQYSKRPFTLLTHDDGRSSSRQIMDLQTGADAIAAGDEYILQQQSCTEQPSETGERFNVSAHVILPQRSLQTGSPLVHNYDTLLFMCAYNSCLFEASIPRLTALILR